MEQIIADRCYDRTRKLIQSHIKDEILDDNSRNQMISFYELLTVENAKITYEEVFSLLVHANDVDEQKLHDSRSKFFRTTCLTGMVITSIAIVGMKYTPKSNSFYDFVTYAGIFGVAATLIGISGIFS